MAYIILVNVDVFSPVEVFSRIPGYQFDKFSTILKFCCKCLRNFQFEDNMSQPIYGFFASKTMYSV